MKDNKQIASILILLAILLLAGCSTTPSSRREATHSYTFHPINFESVLTDRSNWIDGPPRQF
ncbi:MAG: hypothetical protein QOJ40_325 [Verrucomicrobiota bacterium]